MGVDGFNQVKGAVFGWVVDWGVNWTVCLRIGGGDKNLSSLMESGGVIGFSMMSRTTGWELR